MPYIFFFQWRDAYTWRYNSWVLVDFWLLLFYFIFYFFELFFLFNFVFYYFVSFNFYIKIYPYFFIDFFFHFSNWILFSILFIHVWFQIISITNLVFILLIIIYFLLDHSWIFLFNFIHLNFVYLKFCVFMFSGFAFYMVNLKPMTRDASFKD